MLTFLCLFTLFFRTWWFFYMQKFKNKCPPLSFFSLVMNASTLFSHHLYTNNLKPLINFYALNLFLYFAALFHTLFIQEWSTFAASTSPPKRKRRRRRRRYMMAAWKGKREASKQSHKDNFVAKKRLSRWVIS